MRKGVYILVVLLLSVSAKTYFGAGSPESGWSLVQTVSASPSNTGCNFPTMMAATPEQTAWELFVAANCQANKGQLVWETWIEQSTLYPANGVAGAALQEHLIGNRLHGSPLAIARMKRLHATAELAPSSQCNAMGGPPASPPSPPLIATPIICEEVHINPAAQGFITGQSFQTRPPQTAAAQKGTDIEFPTTAVEIKADWIPSTDFQTPFTCANPPAGVHVETIGGTCYALAGVHIISKLLKDWVWATFEPQSMTTNPLRCQTFGPCNDPWGSTPATSSGGANGFTKPTAAVVALMKKANLAGEFLNYRLDGVQTTFTTSTGAPTYLGNSVIEGENVGQTFNTASCITCHSVSSIENNGTDGITQINDQVGPQYPIPQGWIARDFVWSLGLACPDVQNGGGLQTCTTSAAATKPKKR